MSNDINTLIEYFEKGSNIFLSGQAGTGKTHMLNEFIDYLDDEGLNYALAGSTGTAAVSIGGTTVHRLFGIQLSKNKTDYREKVASGEIHKGTLKNTYSYLREVELIIIDEISMIGHDLLELIDFVLKVAKQNDFPFGGVQVIFVGDFLQLPPINDAFAFQSKIWEQANIKLIYLEEVKRQSDKEFVNVLTSIRKGKVSQNEVEYLLGLNNDLSDSSTKLFARNNNVDKENDIELSKLNGESKTYKAIQRGEASYINAITKGLQAPIELRLKEGAKVMVLINHEDLDYVNGSLGIVKKLSDNEVTVKLENGITTKFQRHTWKLFEKGEVKAEVEQFPLKLAYAITMHKSQGATIDGEVQIECSSINSPGQFYVALSRVVNPNKIRLINFNRNVIKTNVIALSYYEEIKNSK